MSNRLFRYLAALLLAGGAISAQPAPGKFDGVWTDTSGSCPGSTYTIRQAPSGQILSVAIKVTCNQGSLTGAAAGSGFTSKNATTIGWSYRYSSHSPALLETGVSELVLATDGKSARLTSRDSVAVSTGNDAGHSGMSVLVRSSQPQPPPPPATGVRYRVENLVYGAPDLYQNPRNYHDFMVDFAKCSIRELNQPSDQGLEQVHVSVCRSKTRLQFTTVTPNSTQVEYDWVFLDGGKTISGAYRQGSTFGPSFGGIYNP